MRVDRSVLILVVPLVFAFSVSAQQPLPATTQVSTPQPSVLAQQAQTALNGAVAVSDMTLTGTATRTLGPDSETGNFTLKALGDDLSRFDLVLAAGTSTEIYNISAISNGPEGIWISTDGTSHPIADHNCYAGEVWFSPSLSIVGEVSNPNLVLAYVGAETKNGVAVQHLTYSLVVPSAVSAPNALLTQLSTTDVYLNASTYLPVAIVYNTHPDTNLLVNIPVEIDFSSYQVVQGVQVPFHVQKLLNGTLLLDLTVQSATVNSGLTASAFSAS